MLDLAFNLVKKRGGYVVTLTANENGKTLHTDILEPLAERTPLSVRKKIITLDNKRLTLTLNVVGNSPKGPKKVRRKKKLKQLKKSGK